MSYATNPAANPQLNFLLSCFAFDLHFSLLTFADSAPVMTAPIESQVFPQNYYSEKSKSLYIRTFMKTLYFRALFQLLEFEKVKFFRKRY